MERLNTSGVGIGWFGFLRCGRERWAWEFRRIVHLCAGRLGFFGWSVMGASLLALIALFSAQHFIRQTEAWRNALAAAPKRVSLTNTTLASKEVSGSKDDLRAFEARLLPHEAIPWAVGDILAQAEKQGLVVQHAEYQVNEDAVGGFLRYRMVLPIRGSSEAVYQFVLSALWAQRNLALEGVQFKRDNAAAETLEARVHWVLLVRLPTSASSSAGSRGARQ